MTENEKIESRINWRHRWLAELFFFSHIEYQKGLWFDHKFPNEIGWFEEDICKYFDDLYLDDHYEYHIKEGNITTEEFLKIKDFHFKLDEFVQMTNRLGDKFNEDKILENKEWLEICSAGKASWNELKKIISNPEEIDHMNGLEMNYLE